MPHLIIDDVSVVHAPLLVLHSAVDLAVAQVHGEFGRDGRVLGRVKEQAKPLTVIRLEQVRMKQVKALESNLQHHQIMAFKAA